MTHFWPNDLFLILVWIGWKAGKSLRRPSCSLAARSLALYGMDLIKLKGEIQKDTISSEEEIQTYIFKSAILLLKRKQKEIYNLE